jgi:hypothetical protein
MSNTKLNPWDWDLRVRERNVKAGVIDDKDLQKHLAGLTDVSDQVESFSVPQPALELPEAALAPEDDIDDEEEDDVDDEPAEAPPAS